MMWRERVGLCAILLLALVLRWTGLGWDGYNHYHPDERYITWVATTIEWPADWSTAFNPAQSTFNPYYWPPGAESQGIEVLQDQPRKFAYGHVPLYAGVAVTRLLEWVGPSLRSLLPVDWPLVRDVLNGVEAVEFRHLTAVSRALTGLIDVGTVWLVFLLGRRLYGTAVGLLAAAFLAVNVMHIQLAHFFISDPYVTFFGVAAVYWLVVAVQEGGEGRGAQGVGRGAVWVAAVFVGLAIGSKFGAVLLLLPLTVAIWFISVDLSEFEPQSSQRTQRKEAKSLRSLRFNVNQNRFVGRLVGAGLVVFAAFFVTNPFAVLDQSCELLTPAVQLGSVTIPAIDWRSCYLDNILLQGRMVRGELNAPFTFQYDDTTPYLYYLEMQFKAGMGPQLAVPAFLGFAWVVWGVLARKGAKAQRWNGSADDADRSGFSRIEGKEIRLAIFRQLLSGFAALRERLLQADPAQLVILAFLLPFFLSTGNFYVKFMRYLQPMVPFLMVYGAALIWQLRPTWLRWGAVVLVGGGTAVYALTFVNLYQQEHPWITASKWVYDNIEPGTLILSEQWDDALPTTLLLPDGLRRRGEYGNAELTWLTGSEARDNEAKLDDNLALLAEAEYLTLMSNRVYGVVPRTGDRFPISSQYHQLLLDGKLGYEVVWINGRFPHLGPLRLIPNTFTWPSLHPNPVIADYLADQNGLNWGRLDESFTVYDQPLTIIFQNKGHLSAAEMKRLFVLQSSN